MKTEQLVLLIIIPAVFLMFLPLLTRNKDKDDDKIIFSEGDLENVIN